MTLLPREVRVTWAVRKKFVGLLLGSQLKETVKRLVSLTETNAAWRVMFVATKILVSTKFSNCRSGTSPAADGRTC